MDVEDFMWSKVNVQGRGKHEHRKKPGRGCKALQVIPRGRRIGCVLRDGSGKVDTG